AERLAKGGLKLNRFHTTALCSPTRQALLTGRNHHSVNMGAICELATSAPGYSSVLPKDKAPLAMTLKLNGYSTAQFGKEGGSPVSPDYGPKGNAFSGKVNWVQIDLEKDDQDHLISPEERFRIAMARQ